MLWTRQQIEGKVKARLILEPQNRTDTRD
jgi:hypothetical protein